MTIECGQRVKFKKHVLKRFIEHTSNLEIDENFKKERLKELKKNKFTILGTRSYDMSGYFIVKIRADKSKYIWRVEPNEIEKYNK